MKWPTEHDRGVMECFSSIHLAKRMVIAYYTGTLIFPNLYGEKNLDRRYGEEVIFVSLKEIQKYAVHIGDDVKDSAGRELHACRVLAQLN